MKGVCSVWDFVTQNVLLEILPTVEGVLSIAAFAIRHAAHCANVGLNSLLFVLGDGYGGQIDCKEALDHVKVAHIFLQLALHCLFLHGILLLLRLIFEHAAQGELICIQLVDLFLEICDFFLGLSFTSFHQISLLYGLVKGFQAPNFALNPVVDMNERILVVDSHLLQFILQV